jgi:hypothetical protein
VHRALQCKDGATWTRQLPGKGIAFPSGMGYMVYFSAPTRSLGAISTRGEWRAMGLGRLELELLAEPEHRTGTRCPRH